MVCRSPEGDLPQGQSRELGGSGQLLAQLRGLFWVQLKRLWGDIGSRVIREIEKRCIRISNLPRGQCHRFKRYCCCCPCQSTIVEFQAWAVSVTGWVRWLTDYKTSLHLQSHTSLYKLHGYLSPNTNHVGL